MQLPTQAAERGKGGRVQEGVELPLVESAGGVVVKIRLRPAARATRLIAVHGDAIRAEVRAAPEAGKANQELLSYLAELLNTERGAISLLAGAGSRSKTVLIAGLSRKRVAEALGAALRPT